MKHFLKRVGLTNSKSKYLQNTNGNIAITFSLLFPVLAGGFFLAHDINMQTAEKEFARTTAQIACNRIVQASITQYPSFEAKKDAGKAILDKAYEDRDRVKDYAYDIDLDMHEAEVTVTAQLNTLLNIDKLASSDVNITVDCAGIPAFPRVDEVIYEGRFGESVTDETPYSWQSRDGCWGTIDAERIGWNFTSSMTRWTTDHCGIEIQDWNSCSYFIPGNAQDNTHDLPEDSTDGMVVELDGNCNTAINKPLELHPGTYEFSIWYRGRSPAGSRVPAGTNDIGMYLQRADETTLQPLEALSQNHKVLTMSDDLSRSWEQYKYTVIVPEYDIYVVTLMGEGRDDSRGGLFTSFELTYKELGDTVSGGTVSGGSVNTP